MVHLHRTGVEWFSLASTIWALDGTYGAFEKHHVVSQVTSLVPVIISDPEFVVGEEAFSLHSCLFAFDFFCFGVWVVPGFGHEEFGLIFAWHDQLSCAGSEGIFFSELLHDCWHASLIFSS